MKEELLQFVWQNQLFNKHNLITTENQSLKILKQGHLNSDSGPDFSEAKIVMDGLEWVGDVEIHYKSSNWSQHKHEADPSYNKTVLHVVWEHDSEVKRNDGTTLPTLAISSRADQDILDLAQELLNSPSHVPCQRYLKSVDQIHVAGALNRSLIQRLEAKSDLVEEELVRTNGDWEEVAFILLAQALGSKVNGSAFKQLASRLPLKVLKQYAGNIFQLEALLFGMSGMLKSGANADPYLTSLIKEFNFLSQKHGLLGKEMELSWWKFMRLRPSNFPTLRIAQFVQIISEKPNVFSFLTKSDITELKAGLGIKQSEYWQQHYKFGKRAKRNIPGLGQSSIDNIILNVSTPLLVAYGRKINDESYNDTALTLLSILKPEVNRITKMWQTMGVAVTNAAESQGAIELYNNECTGRRCLQCNVGYQILNRS